MAPDREGPGSVGAAIAAPVSIRRRVRDDETARRDLGGVVVGPALVEHILAGRDDNRAAGVRDGASAGQGASIAATGHAGFPPRLPHARARGLHLFADVSSSYTERVR